MLPAVNAGERDLSTFLNAGVAGGICFGIYTLMAKKLRTQLDPGDELSDFTFDHLHKDQELFETLVFMHQYKDIDPGAYGALIMLCDHIMHYEHGFDTKQLTPRYRDAADLESFFRVAVNRVYAIRDAVAQHLDPKHMLIVEPATKKLVRRLEHHLQVALRHVHDFDPEVTRRAAPGDIQRALKDVQEFRAVKQEARQRMERMGSVSATF